MARPFLSNFARATLSLHPLTTIPFKSFTALRASSLWRYHTKPNGLLRPLLLLHDTNASTTLPSKLNSCTNHSLVISFDKLSTKRATTSLLCSTPFPCVVRAPIFLLSLHLPHSLIALFILIIFFVASACIRSYQI